MNQIRKPYKLYFFVTLVSLHAQSITDPNLPAEGKVMNFDQIDDTLAVSSVGPWDFSTINAYRLFMPMIRRSLLDFVDVLR